MVSLTEKEKKALLIVFKDFTEFYNANSISKLIDVSHVGAQKIFKRLLSVSLLTAKQIGKSIAYRPDLENDYVRKLIAFLLADEANCFRRWKEEFQELNKKDRIVAMFGSAVKNYAKAEDIDLLLVIAKRDSVEVDAILKERRNVLPKELHAIKLTQGDLLKNLRNREKVSLDAVRTAIVLYGQDKYVEILRNVTGF